MLHLLMEPIDMGPIHVPNRILMPAMHLNYTMGGEVSDQLVNFYRARAVGGAGMIIIGGCSIDNIGGGPFLIGLYDDRFLPGLERFVKEVGKDVDTKLGVQLYHAGRYSFSWYTQEQPIAPSALASRYNREIPREMTKEDIETVQQAFADAAARAAKAGFHAVEIVGSAGYLVSQFLSPASNQRTDEYGGPLENRARFGVEVIRRVREAVGDDVAVLIRVAGHDFVPGGHTNRESALATQIFVEAGVDAVNVTGGWHESRVPQITMGVPEGAYTYLAAGIKRAVNVPVIASNRLGDPMLAAQVLANGDADMIAMGRPLIADPELPMKVKAGTVDDVRPCIACNQGCFDHVFGGAPVQCVLNAQAGYEAERLIGKAETPKRVVVVGAGPAGIEAARVAAMRGHQVTVMEKSDVIGGALWYAAASPGRHDFFRYVQYMENELDNYDIELWLGVEATLEKVQAEEPDIVIVAAGAEPIIPGIVKRATHPNVVLAEQVLAGKAILQGDVVVVGGGAVGAETALQIAHRDTIDPEVAAFLIANEAESLETVRDLLTKPRRKIYVCDLLPKIAQDMGKTTRWTVLQELRNMSVELHTNSEVTAIDEQGVSIKTPDGVEQTLACGTVVVAVGYLQRDDLAKELETAGLDVVLIGDAKKPRKVAEAVHEGFLTALKI
ncbi:MAG: FAD-dependent oxidoreductase [Candidatus Lernaella stagnicola]|nr:FAD-dependent oxidoreductase [Candidatus Lernaella stagnicola]